MTMTNEPGYYEEGAFGIRIEDVMLVTVKSTPHQFGGSSYLGFENITLVPMAKNLLDLGIMSPHEIKWLDNYHNKCLQTLQPLLKGRPLEYLTKACSPIEVTSIVIS